ncbi:hypothetical protein J4573_10610 [Actinomadura barringtoniae]|uniref:Hydrogenase maturation nickel metallochaperone HypA n=1 Tax=Actinomadura barringtoniae TaxID=1427535 RepID=A0A939PD87_9ACTN|nr:DUF6510 family protein [Actinomadura barringtoniae]MBO2447539.1 hypothetical protein [Actinomadura barringtoniae]
MTDFLDGNALAGPLGEVFAADITTAVGQCAHCGLTGAIATLRVYGPEPGMVARCPGCEGVVLRLVRTPDAAMLDFTGARSIRFPLPPS